MFHFILSTPITSVRSLSLAKVKIFKVRTSKEAYSYTETVSASSSGGSLATSVAAFITASGKHGAELWCIGHVGKGRLHNIECTESTTYNRRAFHSLNLLCTYKTLS